MQISRRQHSAPTTSFGVERRDFTAGKRRTNRSWAPRRRLSSITELQCRMNHKRRDDNGAA
jgi:hypothetical protein